MITYSSKLRSMQRQTQRHGKFEKKNRKQKQTKGTRSTLHLNFPLPPHSRNEDLLQVRVHSSPSNCRAKKVFCPFAGELPIKKRPSTPFLLILREPAPITSWKTISASQICYEPHRRASQNLMAGTPETFTVFSRKRVNNIPETCCKHHRILIADARGNLRNTRNTLRKLPKYVAGAPKNITLIP